MADPETGALVTTKKEKKDLALSASKEIKTLEKQLDIETQRRALITKYIASNLVEGVDWGRIHISKNCDNKYNCKNKNHMSKPNLFKPGSEKFLSLLHLTPKFKKDTDTWQMLDNRPGVVCYICELYDQKGNLVGEGRGVGDAGEESGSFNKLVKLTEKRAQMDAILRMGGLSDVFTQDLEDDSQRKALEEGEASRGTPRNANTSVKPRLATEKQIVFIKKLLGIKGKTEKSLFLSNNIKGFNELTANIASQSIDKLLLLPDKKKLENSGDVQSFPDDAPDAFQESMSEDVDPADIPDWVGA